MSTPQPLAERMLEWAIEEGLTPEAATFLGVRNRLLFGERDVRDLSKADDHELYGRRQAFNRLMLELFDSGNGMPIKPKRISRKTRARRGCTRVDQVPKTQELVVGARHQDQSAVITLLREFSVVVGEIIDPEDIFVTTCLAVPKEDPLHAFQEDVIGERLETELKETLKYSNASRDYPKNPVIVLHVRQEDKGRKVRCGDRLYDLKEDLIEKIRRFWRRDDTARDTWKKLYLNIYWEDEKEEIEVELPRESAA